MLASSYHAVGFTPVGHTVSNTETSPRPDSVYGVGKVAGEALGSLYAHKHHLSVVAIRVGSFRLAPTEPRHAATWLSPRDGCDLFHTAATQPLPHPFTLVYGTSDNPVRWWPRDHWRALDYQPRDSADDHLAEAITDAWHGGSYAASRGDFPTMS